MTADPRRPLVDPRRTACLGTGWHAVIAIGPGGSESAWLLSPDGNGSGAAPPTPPHERLGPLPLAIAARLARPVQPRCGRPRRDGAPCGTYVSRHGAACAHHAGQRSVQP